MKNRRSIKHSKYAYFLAKYHIESLDFTLEEIVNSLEEKITIEQFEDSIEKYKECVYDDTIENELMPSIKYFRSFTMTQLKQYINSNVQKFNNNGNTLENNLEPLKPAYTTKEVVVTNSIAKLKSRKA